MTDGQVWNELIALLGGMAALLALFTGIITWFVKANGQASKEAHKAVSDELKRHIDTKLDSISNEVTTHANRLDQHDQELGKQRYAQLELRNEILEKMQGRYARHEDILEIKDSLKAIFGRMDKMIFTPPGGRK